MVDEFNADFRDKYISTIEGKDYIAYSGLLRLAHDRIRSIKVELLQPPLPSNGGVTIVHATIEDTDGRIWEDIGDASDDTCESSVALHKIRLASTRAKGRALRDMLGIDMVMKEEVFPDKKPAVNPAAISDGGERITAEQGQRITQIMQANNISHQEARELLTRKFGKETLKDLTVAEADAYIEELLKLRAQKLAS